MPETHTGALTLRAENWPVESGRDPVTHPGTRWLMSNCEQTCGEGRCKPV